MRLGIDLDGVVADFTEGWQRFYNAEFGTSLSVADSVAWNDVIDLTHFNGMDEFWDWASDLNGRSVFWHLNPYPGAVEALHSLSDDGHEIVVITHKPRFAFEDTRDWLARVDFPATEVNILDMTTEPKWKVDCDVYLDDGPHVLPGLIKNRPDRVVCRFVRPWNSPLAEVVDVHDFDEFRDIVRRLSGDRQGFGH